MCIRDSHRTEWQATTQGLPTETSVGPNRNNNDNENWVTVSENPGFSILHNQSSNDGGPRIARINHIMAEDSQEPNNCLLYTSRCV